MICFVNPIALLMICFVYPMVGFGDLFSLSSVCAVVVSCLTCGWAHDLFSTICLCW